MRWSYPFRAGMALLLGMSLCAPQAFAGPKKKGRTAAPVSSVEETLQRIQKALQDAQKELDGLLAAPPTGDGAGGTLARLDELIKLLNKNIAAIGAHLTLINSRLDTLEKQRPAGGGAAAPEAVSALEAKLQEIGDRVNGIEDDMDNVVGEQDKVSALVKKNKLLWSGSYRITLNTFNLRDQSEVSTLDHVALVTDSFGLPVTDPATGGPMAVPVYARTPQNINKWYSNSWVNRLRLTMTWEITDNLRFYGQAVVFKYLNDIKNVPVTLDMHTTRYPRDTTLRMERFYIDWFITDWLALSAGRITAAEGPPAEIKENSPRMSTWGVQLVEAEMETVNLTFHLARLLEGTTLRVYYMPFTSHADFTLNDDLKIFQDPGIDPMHAFGSMLELKVPGLGDNLIQAAFVIVPEFRPRNIPILYPGIADPIYPIAPTSQDLGFYMKDCALVELKDIGGSGLDFFASYTLTVLKPTAGRMRYQLPFTVPVINPTTGAQVSTTQPVYETGLASFEEGAGTTNLGHMIYTGLRYTFPWKAEYASRLGFEFNRGTKYHISWSSMSDLLVNKYATKGNALEVYWIQQLMGESLFARLGYVMLLREYQGLYIGPTTKIDQTVSNLYLLLDARW